MQKRLEKFMRSSPVVPVVVIDDAAHAVPVAQALLAGGVQVIEITLRSEAALKSIELIARSVPDIRVAAGTVLNAQHLKDVQQAGARVAISPGVTESLLHAAELYTMPLLPGIATPSELMLGLDAGLTQFKLFPATAINGLELAKALSGPFPQARFCPTGGITWDNAVQFLAQSNIECVGASWLASREDIQAQRWEKIADNAKRAMQLRG
jgi:2-dehydro-3-deoxyphosphogluconate aldolase / (4S)-4-hydroxy-2-oxoglutarate aldolase